MQAFIESSYNKKAISPFVWNIAFFALLSYYFLYITGLSSDSQSHSSQQCLQLLTDLTDKLCAITYGHIRQAGDQRQILGHTA